MLFFVGPAKLIDLLYKEESRIPNILFPNYTQLPQSLLFLLKKVRHQSLIQVTCSMFEDFLINESRILWNKVLYFK